MRSILLTLATVTVTVAAAAGTPDPVPQPIRSLLAETRNMQTATNLWPGFEPEAIPVAIYDGERTWLAAHPEPPAGFDPVEPGLAVTEGRHPSVDANTSSEIGGVATATLLAETEELDDVRAGILIHEKFHVFQRQRHPDWIADETALFNYPAEDAEVLAYTYAELARLESALAMGRDDDAACEAGAAIAMREARHALLDEAAATYERGTELNEGLARYIEDRARRRGAVAVFEHRADAVRLRAYGTGAAYAHLLDRLRPDWKQRLEESTRPLDRLLAEAVTGVDPAPCVPDQDAIATHRTDAVEAVAELDERRARLRRQFLAQDGRTVVIEADPPLWPAGFDPINVTRLGPGAVLHSRMVKLSNDQADIQVIGRAVITEAAGEHPLFQGVRRITIAGLEDLSVSGRAMGGGPIRLRAEGLEIVVEGAEMRGGEGDGTLYLSL